MSVRAIPLLPCPSIDDITDFYEALGFTTTFRQSSPNPYVAVERDGLELHYFGVEGFDPDGSYGTCVVLVDDTEPWFEAIAAGLRERYDTLPMSGVPRITRPRLRENARGLSGFSLIDPGGNAVRFTRGIAEPVMEESRLATAYAYAVVLADSNGDPTEAATLLAGAIRREDEASPIEDRVQALAYLAELWVRADDPEAAARTLDELGDHPLTPEIEEAVADLRRSLNRA
ncbi:VOC family protein [Mumia sp. zg.B53]|uniref:VOC family protein n=1 Tax=Mumia sp. zg.B53 TaxID=2855449 RepID=UPI001C6E720E|nr:VOC family protein [Mumia sp. zg.B53]MBW9214618.1 VOC family protein [Mumia sp. zg.B53]